MGLPLNLSRGGSIKDLISKFSGGENGSYSGYLSDSVSRRGRLHRAASLDVLGSPGQERASAKLDSAVPVQRPVFKEFDIPELKEVEIPAPSGAVPTSVETGAKEPDSAQANAKMTRAERNTGQTGSEAAPTPRTAGSGSDSVADSGVGSVSIPERGGAGGTDVHVENSPSERCSSFQTNA